VGQITGTGSLTQTGANALTYGQTQNQANTYTGITTVNGTVNLSLTNNQIELSGQLVINNGGTVTVTTNQGNALQAAGTIATINAGGNLVATGGNTIGLTGVVLNGGTLSGAGVWALSGGQAVPIIVLAGSTASTINVATFDLQTGAGGFTRPIIVQPGTGLAAGQELTISGAFNNTSNTNTGTGFTKLGTGTMILSGGTANNIGSNANNVIGLISVNEGTLQLSKTAAVAALGGGNVVVGTYSGSATLQVTTNNNQTNTAAVFVNATSNGGGVFNLFNSTTTQTVGTLQVDGGTVNTGGNILTLGGNVVGLATNGATTGTVQSVAGGVTSVPIRHHLPPRSERQFLGRRRWLGRGRLRPGLRRRGDGDHHYQPGQRLHLRPHGPPQRWWIHDARHSGRGHHRHGQRNHERHTHLHRGRRWIANRLEFQRHDQRSRQRTHQGGQRHPDHRPADR
jgi:hypothetical protein